MIIPSGQAFAAFRAAHPTAVLVAASAANGAITAGTSSVKQQFAETGSLGKINWGKVALDTTAGGFIGGTTGALGSGISNGATTLLSKSATISSLLNSESAVTRIATNFAIGSVAEVGSGMGTRFVGGLLTGGGDFKEAGMQAINPQNILFDAALGGTLNGLKGIKVNKNDIQKRYFNSILEKNNISIEEFQDLKLKPVDQLTENEVMKLKEIRDSIPKITPDTELQKTIPFKDLDKYLDGTYTEIGGYIAKLDDVGHITNYDDVVESSRLDYELNDGSRPFPENGNSYGKIIFNTDSTDEIGIPYGKRFGGMNIDSYPCTQNGFTGSRNGEIVPEWQFNSRVTPNDGAKLYSVIDGKEKLVGVFDSDLGKFVDVSK